MSWFMPFAVVNLALGLAWGQTAKARKTDAQLKQEIIRESIGRYRGSCPCLDNTDRAGRMCGRPSAYSRFGGRSLICDEQDVTRKMVDDYRKRTGE